MFMQKNILNIFSPSINKTQKHQDCKSVHLNAYINTPTLANNMKNKTLAINMTKKIYIIILCIYYGSFHC